MFLIICQLFVLTCCGINQILSINYFCSLFQMHREIDERNIPKPMLTPKIEYKTMLTPKIESVQGRAGFH